jgi:hypothetical protein
MFARAYEQAAHTVWLVMEMAGRQRCWARVSGSRVRLEALGWRIFEQSGFARVARDAWSAAPDLRRGDSGARAKYLLDCHVAHSFRRDWSRAQFIRCAAFDPSGQRIAEIAIDGSTYELWHAANVGDASGASAAQWTHIVYRSQDAQHRGSLDLKQFLDDAAERGLLAGSEYVSSIEIGNEVMSGSGKTWINELKLEIER